MDSDLAPPPVTVPLPDAPERPRTRRVTRPARPIRPGRVRRWTSWFESIAARVGSLPVPQPFRRLWRAVVATPTWVFLVLLAVPVVVAGVAALVRGFTPAGDEALLELMVRDVGSADTPLVGPYSRYGWNHPGPLLYYALAPAYRLFGASGGAMLASVTVLNLAAIGGSLALAHRRGGRALVLATTGVLALMLFRLGPTFLWDPWNPHSTLLPFLALVLLTWNVVEGERWAVPVSVAVASLVLQSHVGYLGLVAVLGACQVLGLLRLHRQREFADHGTTVRRRGWELAGITLLVGLVCWAPVAVDAARGGDNIARMVTYFRTDNQAAGAGPAVAVAARHLARGGPWITGLEESEPIGGGLRGGAPNDLVVPVAVFAAAAWLARRNGAAAALRFQAIVGACTVAGLAATARVTAPVYGYLVKWWWVLAALWWLSAGWSIWSSLTVRGRRRIRLAATPALLYLLVLVAIPGSTRAWEARMPADAWHEKLGPLSEAAIERLPRTGPVQVRATGSVWGNVGDTMRNELDRAGITVVVDPIDTFKYGNHRSSATTTPTATVWVVSADAVDDWEARSDTCELAVWDPLDAEQRARYKIDAKLLDYQFEAAGRHDLAVALATFDSLWTANEVPQVDQALVHQIDDLRRLGERTAVFLELPDHRSACTAPPARI